MIAQDVTRRALRIAGVIASGETPDSDTIADALATFNALLAEWHVAGIGIPDYTVASEGATLSTDLADREALAYQLAFRIGPEYGFEPSPSQLVAADQSWSRLRLRYFQPGTVDFSELPSKRIPFDVTTG